MALQLFTVMYGENPQYQLELYGSALSALTHCPNPDDIRITVFSDRDRLDDVSLPIHVCRFDPTKWAEWTYGGKATHFIKMHLMAEMLENANGPVLYFDTDVIFLDDPLKIAAQIDTTNTLMHTDEGPLDKHYLWDDLIVSLQASKDPLADLINSRSRMYNSGIMGMLPEHRPMMLEAIELAHKIYQLENIFSIDQIATGTILRQSTQLNTCTDQAYHYWGWVRPFIHRHLETLKKDYQQHRLSPSQTRERLHQLASAPVIDFRDKFKVQLARLRRNTASPFAYLAYLTALRQASKSPVLANLWLDTCLACIGRSIKSAPKRNISRGDRYLLNAIENIGNEWVAPKTRQYLEALIQKIGEH